MIGKISPSLFLGCKLSLAAPDFTVEILVRFLRSLLRNVNCVIPNDVCVWSWLMGRFVGKLRGGRETVGVG